MTSVLFVTTVPITLKAFLLPFADRCHELGWHVDALANGASAEPALEGHFDRIFDAGWSRDPLSLSNVVGTPRRVRSLLVEGRYDLVHVHTPIAAWITRRAAHALPSAIRPKVIYTAHGFHFYSGQRRAAHAAYRFMERVAAPWTDYLVTVNDEDYTAARKLGGIAPERVRLIRGIGVDTDRFAPGVVPPDEVAAVRRGLGISPDATVLTMIAEFAPVKRHRLALEAVARVSDPRLVLLLVGDGPLRERIAEEASRLGVQDRVRFAGYRTDIPAVLAASDALLLCSVREGLNRSVLEAMASGVPVIGTPTRGIADAVGHSAGWITPNGDPSALARAMDDAASSPDERRRRGTAARTRAEAEFALHHVLAAYEELYREALASGV